MANVPGHAWPEPAVYLAGSVLHVDQARWRQRDTFLPLVEPAKWMVVVYVNDVIVHGQVPSTAANNTTAYAAEMPLTTTTFTLDLAGHGVDLSHPLSPKVHIEQYAATKLATGWQWQGTDWERLATPLRIIIDSKAGVATPADDDWVPLSRCFYDEGAETPADFTYIDATNIGTLGALDGSIGMQFTLELQAVTIDGIQLWSPPVWWDTPGFVPPTVTVRLWEGGAHAPPSAIVRTDSATVLPGWTNIMFDTPYPAKTRLIRDPAPPVDDPYRMVINPDHTGTYIVGFQSVEGKYREGPVPTAYQRLYPETDKVFMYDNFPAGSHLRNRSSPTTEKGPEWAPNSNVGKYVFCGPIVTYTPVYPVPKVFVPQIYRRVLVNA